MKFFFTVTKRSLSVTLFGMTAIFLIFFWSSSLKIQAIDGSTHANRMLYINSLGIDVDEEKCTSKETVIPEEFGDVYERYNELQLESGFDLSGFKGERVTVYSYPLKTGKTVLTLLVHNGEIIGGDIAEIGVNGKMIPLGK